MKLSPSLLAADFARLAEEVARVEQNADMLHLDVMDGVFVPNISFGPAVIAALRPHSRLFFDVHLMIERPERYLDAFRRAGADGITVHYEATRDPAAALAAIRTLGARAGIAISPKTPAEVLFPLLSLCDMVLVMTVEPGFGGQKLITDCLDKVTLLRQKIAAEGLAVPIEADGGIDLTNLSAVRTAGVDVVVAGSAVFRAKDPAAVLAAMRNIAE